MNDTATDSSTRPPAADSRHPDPDVWAAYHAGELPAAEGRQLQAHLTRCRRCVDLVLDLDAFADPVAAPRAGVADFERAAVWRALRGARRPSYRWAAVAAMAASLAFATLGLASWSGQRRAIQGFEARIAELEQPRINVPVLDLRPASRQRAAGAASVTAVVPATAAVIALILHLEEPVAYPDYEIALVDGSGAEVWSRRGLEANDLGGFHLALSPRFLPAGGSELRLYGRDGGERELLEVYPVRRE